MIKSFVIREHDSISEDSRSRETIDKMEANGIKLLGQPEEYLGEPICLGLDKNLRASYYIGATWLVPNDSSLIVLPKVENIDITEMLVKALLINNESDVHYFSKCYKIYFDQPAIEVKDNLSQLTPLLIVHYISLLESLVRQGIKRDYLTISENLIGKVKGHIVLAEQLRKNIIPKRENRNICHYQIYTENIPVNRLLKRALIFSQKMLSVFMTNHSQYSLLSSKINQLKQKFECVSEYIEISEVKAITVNALYRHYSMALTVAKEILRRYDYSLSNVSYDIKSTPPYWIDMSRLFEMYVLSLLRDKYHNDIEFQVEGNGQVADYIHKSERFIMDAKYKLGYKNDYDINDIREVSGNARDIKITHHFTGYNQEEPECLILYPSKNGIISFNGIDSLASTDSIQGFRRFHKIGIKLPTL